MRRYLSFARSVVYNTAKFLW